MKIPRWLFAAYWCGYAAVQSLVFSRVRIDYFDAFDYLRNARRIAGAQVGYQVYKPPFLSLIHAPLQFALDRFNLDALRIVAPHLLQCAIGLIFLACAYRLFRLYLSEGWSQIGTIMLSLNPLTIHYLGFVLPDISAALFMVLFVYYLRIDDRRWPAWLALTAGLLCRWNMAAIPFILVCAIVLANIRTKDYAEAVRLGVILAWSLFSCAVVTVILYRHLFPISWPASGRLLVWVLRSQFWTQMAPSELWSYRSIFQSPLLLFLSVLFVAGMVTPHDQDRSLGYTAILFFLLMNALKRQEARYLYPVFLFFYLFAVAGLRYFYERISQRVAGGVSAGLIGMAVIAVSMGGLIQITAWRQPLYYRDTVTEPARAILPVAQRIFWNGTACSTYVEDRPSGVDPNFGRFDVPNLGSFEYILGKRIFLIDLRQGSIGDIRTWSPNQLGDLPPARVKDLRDGDVVVQAPMHFLSPQEAMDAGVNVLTILRQNGPALVETAKIQL